VLSKSAHFPRGPPIRSFIRWRPVLAILTACSQLQLFLGVSVAIRWSV
jgi:hypothetical protein